MATSDAAPHAPSDVSVMISYSRTDAVFARKLHADLKAAGFPTWLDTSIPGGRLWRREIDQAIDDARVVLVVMSPAAMQSTWVRREYRRALHSGKVVIPLDYYPCNIPALLAERQRLSFRPSFVNAEAFYAQQFQELTNALSGYAPHAPYAPLTTPAPPRAVTTTPSPRPSPRERLLTGALALAALVGILLAGLGGYAKGALLPAFAQPNASRVSLGGVVLFALSLVTLVLQRARRPDGSVNLYLEDHARFLSKVHSRYTNRLKPPFAGALRLTLGLSEAAQAVARPALARQLGPGGEPHLLPAETTIITAFNDAEGQLLILGAPGAGKSWLLYQLALALVEQVRTDVEKASPAPVVFDLASWAQTQKPLAGWMVDQLTETWQVPPDIARVWVAQRLIFPLLDGLDEVRRDVRDACVAAINRYQHDHGLDSLAVCCRKADYDALETRLDLRTAVVAEPLTPEQIDDYLEAGMEPLAVLRRLVQDDTQLQVLLSTPLMLSVVALAYASKEADTVPISTGEGNGRNAWTQAVFRDYVPSMLVRRPAFGMRTGRKHGVEYSVAETTRYLAWLAAQMRAHGRTDVFYLEHLQPNWLPNGQAEHDWRWRGHLVVGLLCGLLGGLGLGLYGVLGFGLVDGLGLGLAGGLCLGLAGGLGLGLAGRGFAAGNAISLTSTSLRLVRHGVQLEQQRAFDLLVGGLTFGLVTGLSIGLYGGSRVGVISGLLGGLGYVLVGGLGEMFTKEEIDAGDLASPNEGVMHALRSGVSVVIMYGLLGGLLGGLGFGLVGYFETYGLFHRLALGVVLGLSLGLVSGLLGGLGGPPVYGLGAYVQHEVLRQVLVSLSLIPPHYRDFLDFAADHVLLQRVGGGYRFIHALLLDYFADQWPDLSAMLPKGDA